MLREHGDGIKRAFVLLDNEIPARVIRTKPDQILTC